MISSVVPPASSRASGTPSMDGARPVASDAVSDRYALAETEDAAIYHTASEEASPRNQSGGLAARSVIPSFGADVVQVVDPTGAEKDPDGPDAAEVRDSAVE